MTDLPTELEGCQVILEDEMSLIGKGPHEGSDDDKYDLRIYKKELGALIGEARQVEGGTFQCRATHAVAWVDFTVERFEDLGPTTERVPFQLYKDLGGD